MTRVIVGAEIEMRDARPIDQLRTREIAAVARALALRVGAHAICPAEVDLLGAVEVVPRRLELCLEVQMETSAEFLTHAKIQHALGKAALCPRTPHLPLCHRRVGRNRAMIGGEVVGQTRARAVHLAAYADMRGIAVLFEGHANVLVLVLEFSPVPPVGETDAVPRGAQERRCAKEAHGIGVSLCAKAAKFARKLVVHAADTEAEHGAAHADGAGIGDAVVAKIFVREHRGKAQPIAAVREVRQARLCAVAVTS